MSVIALRSRDFFPHPEERRLRRVSKDECVASWFETAQQRLLTMRRDSHQIGLLRPSNNVVFTLKVAWSLSRLHGIETGLHILVFTLFLNPTPCPLPFK